MSSAISEMGRSLAKAHARSRIRASVRPTPSWTATVPHAWWTTSLRLAPVSISVASSLGDAFACRASTARVATSATTSASACWSSVSGPGVSR